MMKKPFLTFGPLVAGLVFPLNLAFGHHGWAEFDEKSEITVQGTVIDFHYVNPHCVVDFEVKDEKGHIQKWQGEFSGVVAKGLERRVTRGGGEADYHGTSRLEGRARHTRNADRIGKRRPQAGIAGVRRAIIAPMRCSAREPR